MRASAFATVLLLLSAGHALAAPATAQPPSPRIGTYDSRAVAIAYAGSSFHAAKMEPLRARMKAARESGDTAEIARLESEGKALQAALHKQGFGTAPVEDLLVHVEGDLPRIREAAGVTALVSKWDKAGLARHAGATNVDVTMALVDAFRPDARARKNAVEIQGKRPASSARSERSP